MIIVKITFLLFLITAISFFFFICWVKSNPVKAIIWKYNGIPKKWGLFWGFLIVFDVIGMILSAIWFLFFYL